MRPRAEKINLRSITRVRTKSALIITYAQLQLHICRVVCMHGRRRILNARASQLKLHEPEAYYTRIYINGIKANTPIYIYIFCAYACMYMWTCIRILSVRGIRMGQVLLVVYVDWSMFFWYWCICMSWCWIRNNFSDIDIYPCFNLIATASWRSAVRIPRKRSTHFVTFHALLALPTEFNWLKCLFNLSILYAQNVKPSPHIRDRGYVPKDSAASASW